MGRPGQSRALSHRGAKVERLRRWARVIRRDALTLWLAARDPRVPVVVKLLAACVAAYALSPIDLIPDFIPILGYVDDLVIVPLGLLLVIRMIPDECWPTSASAPPHRPSNRAAWLGPSP